MTQGTDSRNISKLVKDILASNQIDNLKLEIDLTSAWQRYVVLRDEGKTPAESRESIVKEFGVLGFMGVSDLVKERVRMQQIIMDTMSLNVEESNSDWEAVIDFCLKMEKQGQTVRQYQQWRTTDVFNSPKSHQIALKPRLIKDTWPQAFQTGQKETPEVKKDDNDLPMSYA